MEKKTAMQNLSDLSDENLQRIYDIVNRNIDEKGMDYRPQEIAKTIQQEFMLSYDDALQAVQDAHEGRTREDMSEEEKQKILRGGSKMKNMASWIIGMVKGAEKETPSPLKREELYAEKPEAPKAEEKKPEEKKTEADAPKKDEQLKMGEEVEKEHKPTVDKIKASCRDGKVAMSDEDIYSSIAQDHLKEIPDYYTRLAKMEGEAKKKEASLYSVTIKPKEIDVKLTARDILNSVTPLEGVGCFIKSVTGCGLFSSMTPFMTAEGVDIVSFQKEDGTLVLIESVDIEEIKIIGKKETVDVSKLLKDVTPIAVGEDDPDVKRYREMQEHIKETYIKPGDERLKKRVDVDKLLEGVVPEVVKSKGALTISADETPEEVLVKLKYKSEEVEKEIEGQAVKLWELGIKLRKAERIAEKGREIKDEHERAFLAAVGEGVSAMVPYTDKMVLILGNNQGMATVRVNKVAKYYDEKEVLKTEEILDKLLEFLKTKSKPLAMEASKFLEGMRQMELSTRVEILAPEKGKEKLESSLKISSGMIDWIKEKGQMFLDWIQGYGEEAKEVSEEGEKLFKELAEN